MGTGLLQDFFLCLHFFRQGPPRAGAFRTLLLMTCACPAPKDAGAFVSRAVSGSRRGIPRGGSLRRPVPSVPEAGPRAVKTSGRRYTVFFRVFRAKGGPCRARTAAFSGRKGGGAGEKQGKGDAALSAAREKGLQRGKIPSPRRARPCAADREADFSSLFHNNAIISCISMKKYW